MSIRHPRLSKNWLTEAVKENDHDFAVKNLRTNLDREDQVKLLEFAQTLPSYKGERTVPHKDRDSKERTDSEIRMDPRTIKDYGDLLEKIPDHPVVDDNGILRWKKSPFQSFLYDSVDMNIIARHFKRTDPEYQKFYRDIGYSLSGYIEVFGEALDLYI